MSRDKADLAMVAAKPDSFTSFVDDKSLHHIITGITGTANEDVDVHVHDLFTIGNNVPVVKNMDSHSVFSYSHKRSLKVRTLASGSIVIPEVPSCDTDK